MKDQEGRYIFSNQAAQRLSPDFTEDSRRSDYELFPPGMAEAFRRNDKEVLESGKPLELTEVTLHDGQERSWLSIKFPFTDSAGKVLLAGVSLDITERKQLEALTIRQETQRRLLEHALLVQEDERRRIARELHDEAGQLMTSLLVGLRSLSDTRRLADVKTQAKRLREIASDAIGELGRLAQGLHSSVLEDLGLEAALRRYADDFSKTNSIALQIEFHDAPLSSFDGNDQLNLYRIVQEALTNVARHSQAKKASIKFCCDASGLRVTVHDDGEGLAASRAAGNTSGRLGIEGMRQRAAMLGGTLRVISDPEGGTTVELHAPCGEAASSQE